MNCMGSPERCRGIAKKLAADAPQKPALEDDGSQDARAATRFWSSPRRMRGRRF